MPGFRRHRLTAAGLVALLVGGSGPGIGLALAGPDSAAHQVSAVPSGPPAAAPRPPVTDPAPGPAAGLPPPDGHTSLVSVNVNDGFPSGPSVEASISENGRWVAFSSRAADLVANDVNDAQDVFVVDRRNGRPVRLPILNGAAVPPGGRAFDPAISADGSTVVFTYLPPSTFTTTVGSVVLAWDRASNKTTVASKRPNGTAALGSREGSVSGNGRLVAFTSDADGIVPSDGNGAADVFVVDRTTGAATLVSEGPDGPANGPSARPSISSDGTVVAFDSTATDLVKLAPPPVGTPVSAQVYVRTLATGTIELVSRNQSGGYGSGGSQAASTSADGHAIAFESAASDLVPGDPANQDVFVRDRAAGTTTLVSVGAGGGPAAGPSGQAAIASDGLIVAFISTASDLVALGPPSITLAAAIPASSEVYARDLLTGDTIRISEAAAGGPGKGSNVGPAVGGDGRYVAFASNSPFLVAGDDNSLADVFLRDLPPDPVINPKILDFGASALGVPAVPVGGIVSNRGWGPASFGSAIRVGTAKNDFAVLNDGCKPLRLHRTQACTITIGFTPTAKGTRVATLQVPGAFGGSPLTASLHGRGSEASLKLDPPQGNPGIVTVVTGKGFPPNATIRLTWSIGITPKLPTIQTDGDGGFRVQVLVFHHDIVGERQLVATRAAGPIFPDVKAEFLVTISPDIPSTWDWRLNPPFTPPLIIRR